MIAYTHIQFDTVAELEEYLASGQMLEDGYSDEAANDAELEEDIEEVLRELGFMDDEEPAVKTQATGGGSWYIPLGEQQDYFKTDLTSSVDEIVSSQQAFLGFFQALIAEYAPPKVADKGYRIIKSLDGYQ